MLIKALTEALIDRDKFYALPIFRWWSIFYPYRMFADYYQGVVLIHFLPEQEVKDREKIISDLKNFLSEFKLLKIDTAYLITHPKNPKEHKTQPRELLLGKPGEFEIEENGLKYLLKPEQSLYGGLYADTSELRTEFKNSTTIYKKVINLFCFTGSLGLAAAKPGSEILQVDSSPAALDWAKANYQLNLEGLSGANIRFIADDVFNFLEREEARLKHGASAADLIICDPPAFGRGRKKIFSLKQDFPELISKSLKVLAPQGTLIFTCNLMELTPEKMTISAEAQLLKQNLKASISPITPAVSFCDDLRKSPILRGIKIQLI